MIEALDYDFFRRALVAGLLASVACGVVGCYVVVKRISSISGGLSHAAFGGVGLGYLMGFPPMLGAALFALLSGLGIGVAYHRWRSALDTLVSMMWALGMALGILFVSLSPDYAPDLTSYLFGHILFVPTEYLYLVAGLDLVILAVVTGLYRELRAVAFDEEFARTMGTPVELVLQLLLALTALAVVTLIRVVGIILVIALLTMPAATARQWVDDLGRMMVLASVIGAVCTAGGLLLSFELSAAFDANLPTGPLIVLLAALVYAASSTIQAARKRATA